MRKNFSLILTVIIILVFGCLVYWQYGKTATKNSQPSITFVSPNGGEILKEGSIHTIRWSTENIPTTNKVSINIRRVPPPSLQEEGQEFDPLIFVNLENNGSQAWQISEMYPEGNYILGITTYPSIPVINPISDESDAVFRIVKNEIADWQVYSNKEGGYLFKYPEEWNAITNKYNTKNALFGPGATKESGYGGVEYVGNLLSGESLKDFVKEFNSGVEGGSVSEIETTINGRVVVVSVLPKASLEPTEIKNVSFEKDGKVFNMYLMYKTSFTQYPQDEQRLTIFDQILSTFVFID